MDGFNVYRLGIVDYQKALELQLCLLEKRMNQEIEDVLLLLQHPHTFTVGRNRKSEHLLITQEELKEKGIHFEVISRGGDITYHGPGQLVGYPILDLNKLNRDVHKYLRNLEEMIILTLQDFDISAERRKGLAGVWISEKKIASIGVGIKRWITYHGFALNVNTDLSYFQMIVPCGIEGVSVTSIKEITGEKEDLDIMKVETSVINAFSRVFNREIHGVFSNDANMLNGAFDAEFMMGIERKVLKQSDLFA
ncbi:MAG TPA: lipoyl(octanoyl) transferase LipB [Thermodesulfobacteriota bacterium]|nr:lipoyl(octanoyl) transferase LipB [Thermodesulfobacteriota bacterium]